MLDAILSGGLTTIIGTVLGGAARMSPDGSGWQNPDTAAEWLTVPDHPAYAADVLLADARARAK